MNKKEYKLKIYHGPMNIGGIGRYCADWQRNHGAISDFVTYFDHPRKKNEHLNLHLENHGRLKKILIMFSFFITCLFRYDLFHFYYGKSFLHFNLDLPALKLFKKNRNDLFR